MQTTVTKRAIIRDPEAPIGQPAKFWLDCGCGRRLDMTKPTGATCECGTVYDARGRILVGATTDATDDVEG